MVFNEMHREANEGNPEFIRLMEAQLAWTKTTIDDYLLHRPWEYGSIDSADYMEAALRLSALFIDASLNDPDGFLETLSFDYLMGDFACDGVCPELWEKFPDPEEDIRSEEEDIIRLNNEGQEAL